MSFNDHWALKLLGIIAVCFVIQSIFPGFTDLFILKNTEVFSRPWILITSIFLHSGLLHILLNGFALLIFGSILEEIIGSKRFLILYFLGGIIANIVFLLVLPILSLLGMPSSGNALGASGAIFAALGALTVLRPTMTVWVSYMPMPMWIAAIVWAGQDLLGVFIPDNVANFAHLGGLFFGIIGGFHLRTRRKEKNYPKKKKDDLSLSEEELDKWERSMFRT